MERQGQDSRAGHEPPGRAVHEGHAAVSAMRILGHRRRDPQALAASTTTSRSNVLEDPEIRQGIKDYANWPTIPQLYVNGEFIGGCDILREMYASGELQEVLKPRRLDRRPPPVSAPPRGAQARSNGPDRNTAARARRFATREEQWNALKAGSDTLFILMGAVMVLAMHAGFAFLELGTVRRKNQVNALVQDPGRLRRLDGRVLLHRLCGRIRRHRSSPSAERSRRRTATTSSSSSSC